MSTISTNGVSSPAAARRTSILISVAALAVILGVLFVLQLRHFSPFMTDDAFISLRYSQRLLQGHGLTWNDLRPVEGYTNFLWVVLCAGLGALGMPLPFAAHLLGIVTSLVVLVALVVHVYRNYSPRLRFLAALIAGSAMVLSSPFSMWSLGGLEQPLLACMLMWAASLMLSWLDAARPSTGAAMGIGVFLGLACISRADAALFTAAFYTAAVVADKTADGTSMRSLLSRARILPVPILFFVGQLIFRKMYYHEWLPNTAYVKVAFTGHRLYTGIRYVCYAIRTDIVFVLLVAIGSYALWRAGRKKTVAFLLTVGCFWTIYLAVIGGDIFPAYRHFEPVIALFGYLVAGCAFLAVDAAGAWRRGAAAALLMLTALVSTSDALSDQEHWELEGKSLGLFLHQAFGAQQALLSSDAAGVVPFYAELPVLDPLGLNDYHIAHEASRVRGHGWVGHELGDGKYILDKKPDLLLFSSFEDDRPGFPADEQIVSDPRFAQYYQEVRFDTPEPHAIRAMLYIRRIDGRLGIEEGGTKIIVPGYLAKADAANSVHLVDGKAALVIPASGQAFFTGIPVAAGAWDVTIDPASAQGVNLSPDPPTATVQACTQCPAGVEFILQKKQDGEMGLVLSNTTAVPLTVKTITLTRK